MNSLIHSAAVIQEGSLISQKPTPEQLQKWLDDLNKGYFLHVRKAELAPTEVEWAIRSPQYKFGDRILADGESDGQNIYDYSGTIIKACPNNPGNWYVSLDFFPAHYYLIRWDSLVPAESEEG